MSWIFLSIGLGTVLLTLFYRADIFSPGRVYLSIYGILLAVNFMRLSRIQVPWNISTHIHFWGACFCFIAGCFLMGMTSRAMHPQWKLSFSEVKGKLIEDAKALDWHHFLWVWKACVLVFLMSYFVAFIKTGQIPVFAEEADNARLAFSTASVPIYYGLYFGPFSLMLAVEAWMMANLTKQLKWLVGVGFLLTLALHLTIVTRFDIFRLLLFSMVLFHYGKRHLRWTHLASALAAFTFIFMLAFLIRINQDMVGAFNDTIKVKLPPKWAWASNVYAYLANDFWNMNYGFEKFVEGSHAYPFQWGLGLLRSFTLHLLRIEPALITQFGYDSQMNGMVERVSGLNTVIYVWHLYKDFGTVGVFALTLFAGLWITKFHRNLLLSPTLKQLSLWGCLIGAVALSFHMPSWELWFFLLNLAVIAVAHRRKASSSPA